MWLTPKSQAIKERREEKGYSMRSLSIIAGLGKSSVMRMEKNINHVHPLRAEALAKALDCTVDDLFEKED